MSRLKVQNTAVLPRYVNTYAPNTSGYTSVCFFILWVETSKGWFYHKCNHTNKAWVAKFQLKVMKKGWIETKHWQPQSDLTKYGDMTKNEFAYRKEAKAA